MNPFGEADYEDPGMESDPDSGPEPGLVPIRDTWDPLTSADSFANLLGSHGLPSDWTPSEQLELEQEMVTRMMGLLLTEEDDFDLDDGLDLAPTTRDSLAETSVCTSG